ncbi:MAG: Transcriptional regulator MraZ [Fimbriimonadaceae bacterium]|nr:Transcriptional regulator MraZ [Fimbriimonadaceae bacterium]
MANPSIEAGFKPLIGTDEATIDDKGRLLLSKKKRDRLGDGFVVALGDVGCLVAYPAVTWDRMLEQVLAQDSLNQGRQQFTRLVFGLADDGLKWDQQGRVVVPHKLRELAKLKDRVLIVGCVDRLEIWAAEEWDIYNRDPDRYGEARRNAILTAYNRMLGNRGEAS